VAQFVFNPFTGTFDAVSDPSREPCTFPADCQPTDAVNQFVYIAAEAVGGVVQVAAADPTNIAKMPAVGVIVSKSSSTTCLVAWLGVVSLSGFAANKRCFLDSTGFALDSVPTARPVILQVLGQVLDSGRMLLNPSRDLVRLA
jgi:hypothetical protein